MSNRKTAVPDTFVPAAGRSWLTPLYDLGVSLLTREAIWRNHLVAQIAPQPDEHILDIGCGTGSLAAFLHKLEPDIQFTGIDPDGDVLARARRKLAKTGVNIALIKGFLDETLLADTPAFDKLTTSLVLHQVPVPEKHRILRLGLDLLKPGGSLHIADYGQQRSPVMRAAFRIIQTLDGPEYTTPNAEGIITNLMMEVGY
ncbi:MAG: class I SAM-dependent methyltransferase, partial [Kangiella sp.]|nr:class I SAM-dependent methyltransferase [Kangiella sp.]